MVDGGSVSRSPLVKQRLPDSARFWGLFGGHSPERRASRAELTNVWLAAAPTRIGFSVITSHPSVMAYTMYSSCVASTESRSRESGLASRAVVRSRAEPSHSCFARCTLFRCAKPTLCFSRTPMTNDTFCGPGWCRVVSGVSESTDPVSTSCGSPPRPCRMALSHSCSLRA